VTAADEQAMKERRTAVRGRMLVLVPLIALPAFRPRSSGTLRL
jgi:hypothetical protein